ncbi:MAG: response regulator [Thermodesulfobacteriota bacterium]
MTQSQSFFKGKRILAVDDEQDIIESIEDILDTAHVDGARDYESALLKIRENRYDLAILDIMGVNGLKLLEETVARNIPTVMLTAHAINPEALMASIQKGAIAYIPKETLAELDTLLNRLLGAYETGGLPWKLLFELLGSYFDERFGPGWKEKDKEFWSKFSRTYQIGKGIQQRVVHADKVRNKGI